MGLKSRRSSSNQLKTQPSSASVDEFLAGVANEQRARDSRIVLDMMKDITGYEPTLWGDSIVGFGRYEYHYNSGRSGAWPRTGFSPRKQALTVYCMPGFEHLGRLLKKLGRHTSSVSCLYLPALDDVDLDVLRSIIRQSFEEMAERYPETE